MQVQFFKCIEFPHSQSEPSTLSQLKICLPSGCGRAKFQLARCQGLCRALRIADAGRRGAQRSTAVPQYPLASNLFGDSYPLKSLPRVFITTRQYKSRLNSLIAPSRLNFARDPDFKISQLDQVGGEDVAVPTSASASMRAVRREPLPGRRAPRGHAPFEGRSRVGVFGSANAATSAFTPLSPYMDHACDL